MNRPNNLTRAVVLIDGLDPRAVLPATGPHPAFRDVNGAPAVDSLLRHLARQGITDAWLVSRTLPGMVVHYFGDGSAWGLRATHVRQDGPAGSGGGLMAARQYITESTLLIDGALTTDLQLGEMFDAHRSADGDVTICLVDDVRESAGLPRVRIDTSSNLINAIHLDPPFPTGPQTLCAVGAYIVEPESIEALETAGVNADWIRDVLPGLAEGGRAQAYVTDTKTGFDLPRRVRAMQMQPQHGSVRGLNA